MNSGGGKKAAPPPPTGSSPWLVYYDRSNQKNQTFCCNVSSPPVKAYRKSIPALHERKVLACSHGWLVLYDYSQKRLCLCNSTTFDTMPLPSLQHQLKQSTIDSVVLILSSDSDSLKVLVFFEDIQSVMWCKIGDDEWGEISYSNQMKAFLGRGSTYSFLRRVVSCGRKIYARICYRMYYGDYGGRDWYSYEPGFYSMEIVEEPLGLGSISSVPMPPAWGTYVYLLGSFDELFWVYLKWGDMRSIESLVVKVWKYDRGRWKSLKGVNDRAFFLGESYCLSCQESGAGRIYFTKDESLYCYNVEDDSVLVSLPCPDLPARQLSSPIWIMPNSVAANIVEDDQQCIQENDGIKGLVETSSSKENLGENGVLLLEKLGKYILGRILINHLTPLDYMNFRSVSRGCRLVVPLADWRRGLSGSSKRLSYPFPLLMSAVDQTDESGMMYKFMDPRVSNYYMMRVTESVEDGKALIHYSSHGCLLTSMGSHICLRNPFMRSIISITPRWINENENLFFTFVGARCVIISVKSIRAYRGLRGYRGIAVSTISPGEEQWRVEELRSNRKFNATQISPVQFQDAFLLLDQNGNIGKLKLEEGNNVSWHVLEQPKKPCKSFHPNFLVECGGQLLSVCVENGGKAGVAVYKLNQGESGWESVTSLGDYALYLSRSSSFSALITSPGFSNRIYFPSLHGSYGIVFFSLETGKWHSSGSEESSTSFYDTRFLLNSCWIKPQWCKIPEL